jgi:hypothetical protein
MILRKGIFAFLSIYEVVATRKDVIALGGGVGGKGFMEGFNVCLAFTMVPQQSTKAMAL